MDPASGIRRDLTAVTEIMVGYDRSCRMDTSERMPRRHPTREDTMSTRIITTLDDLFLEELSVVLDAERRFLDGNRALRRGATSPALRAMIAAHIDESEGQVVALKRAFAAFEAVPRRVKCDAAEGLVRGAERAMEGAAGSPHVLDCAIASAIASVEHYEVACYRGLVASAKTMERDDLLDILLVNLEQEEDAAARVEATIPGLLSRAMSEVVEG
jgi:ferritin-like metal-binding protein YciE